jgi:hypothetical protein
MFLLNCRSVNWMARLVPHFGRACSMQVSSMLSSNFYLPDADCPLVTLKFFFTGPDVSVSNLQLLQRGTPMQERLLMPQLGS